MNGWMDKFLFNYYKDFLYKKNTFLQTFFILLNNTFFIFIFFKATLQLLCWYLVNKKYHNYIIIFKINPIIVYHRNVTPDSCTQITHFLHSFYSYCCFQRDDVRPDVEFHLGFFPWWHGIHKAGPGPPHRHVLLPRALWVRMPTFFDLTLNWRSYSCSPCRTLQRDKRFSAFFFCIYWKSWGSKNMIVVKSWLCFSSPLPPPD